MSENYDVTIIGAGPAGLFSAIKLVNKGLNVVLIDKGPDLQERVNLSEKHKSRPFGWGGAGTFSDGKIIFSSITGGRLSELMDLKKLNSYISETKDLWIKFIGNLEIDNFTESSNNNLINEAKEFGLELIISDIIHVGSDILPKVLDNIRDYLVNNNINLKMNCEVNDIKIGNNDICLYTSNGKITSKKVIIAPGRGGSKWVLQQTNNLGLNQLNTNVDVGVRVEIPYDVTKHLTDELYEFKLLYKTPSYNDLVRTFCVCPRGIVASEKYDNNVTLVNGYSNKQKNSNNTNFAFLSSINLGPPISKPLEFSDNIIKTVNSISNGILVQRLGDLLDHRRTKTLKDNKVIPTLKDCYPGDLALAYPYRFVKNIIEGLEAIDKIANGIFDDSTLLYSPEVKMYSSMVNVNENMMSDINDLYFCGDGSGTTRGISMACISGLIASDDILKGE